MWRDRRLHLYKAVTVAADVAVGRIARLQGPPREGPQGECVGYSVELASALEQALTIGEQIGR
jgi:hypothetical protein